MRFIANVEVGAYTNDYEDVDPRLLQEYYGVSQRWRSHAAAEETGAGHSDNEMGGEDDRDAEGPILLEGDDVGPPERDDGEDDGEEGDDDTEEDDIASRIARSQRRNLRHAAVEVMSSNSPFDGDAEMEAAFWAAVRDAEEQHWLPDGFDIKPEDWERLGWAGYPESAELKIGRKQKSFVLSLPSAIWLPRAQRWSRALYIMSAFMEQFEL